MIYAVVFLVLSCIASHSAWSGSAFSSSKKPQAEIIVPRTENERLIWRTAYLELQEMVGSQAFPRLEALLHEHPPRLLQVLTYLCTKRGAFAVLFFVEGTLDFSYLDQDASAEKAFKRDLSDLQKVANQLEKELVGVEILLEEIRLFADIAPEDLKKEKSSISYYDVRNLNTEWKQRGSAAFLKLLHQKFPSLTVTYFNDYFLKIQNFEKLSDFLLDSKADLELRLKDHILKFLRETITGTADSTDDPLHLSDQNPVQTQPIRVISATPASFEPRKVRRNKPKMGTQKDLTVKKQQLSRSESDDDDSDSSGPQFVGPGMVSVGPKISFQEAEKIIAHDPNRKLKAKEKPENILSDPSEPVDVNPPDQTLSVTLRGTGSEFGNGSETRVENKIENKFFENNILESDVSQEDPAIVWKGSPVSAGSAAQRSLIPVLYPDEVPLPVAPPYSPAWNEMFFEIVLDGRVVLVHRSLIGASTLELLDVQRVLWLDASQRALVAEAKLHEETQENCLLKIQIKALQEEIQALRQKATHKETTPSQSP